jgi:hypothetical protein
MRSGEHAPGATTGAVRLVLRIEGLCVLAVALLCYAKFGAGWATFAAMFFLPDLSLLGYLGGARAGAIAYNVAHAYVGPLIGLCVAIAFPGTFPLSISLIWGAHIGFDRALGFGLKYSAGFGSTHLGPIRRYGRL